MQFYCARCGHRSAREGTCPSDGHALAQASFGSLLGHQFGNYVVIGELGSGGMGEVYRAVNPLIDKHVAIKVLRASCASDARSHERLLREAQLVNRIESPGVVKVSDAGTLADGRPYIVMELLVGEGLADTLRRTTRPPLAEVFRLMLDVLAVVDAAHRAGIVHRDLKPANVFLAERTFVLDFGVAKLLDPDSDANLTSTGAVIGTPHYMAPEQIEAKQLDARTDVYAAAVILYEMIAGRRPFEGTDFDVMQGHINRRPPPPRALHPEISVELQAIVLTGLAKDPAKRFQSAAAMRTALGHVARSVS